MGYRLIESNAGLPRQLPALQILRALAALSVALLHVLEDADRISARLGGSLALAKQWPLASGVDLFFVISGFVMVYASRDLFGSLAHAGPFLRRRFARIAPIYWIITVVYLILSLGNLAPLNRAKPDLWEIIASFLFIPWIKGGTLEIQPAYNLGWSLNYEMFFYGLFALVLGFQRNVAVPLLVGVLMTLALLGQFIPSSSTQLYFWTRLIILEFGMGMLIAQMALAGLQPTRPFAGLLIVLALILFALGHQGPDPTTYRALYFGPPCALLVIASLAFNRSEERRVGKEC